MIALGSDHAGLPLKKEIIALLEEMNIPYHDYGTYTSDSCDYAMFAQRAAKAVVSGECERGILCCGTGIGISIAANKVKGIRCCACSDCYSAKMCRVHKRREYARARRARRRNRAWTHDCADLFDDGIRGRTPSAAH